MKKIAGAAVAISGILLLGASPAWALSSETTMLLDLLKAKGVITQKDAAEFTKTLEANQPAASEGKDHQNVQTLADRLEKLEGKDGKGLAEIASKINLSVLVEVDMSAARQTDEAGETSNANDITLSTAQLNADAEINQYVNAHMALLYEEDPEDSSNNNITVDEATIGLKGGEALPLYSNLGRMYVPFGHFETHFISDPTTLILGETNDTAAVAGYANDIIDLNAGFFRAKVKDMGQGGDHIDTAVASATFTLAKTDGDKGLAMSAGVSYISNLAASDALVDNNDGLGIHSGEIDEVVDGASAFLSLAYADTYFFDAEYVGALDSFAEGDFDFADAATYTGKPSPQAWNVELAARVMEKTELALRYGGSNEAGSFLADDEYGAAVSYELFDNTSLTVEYLFQEFQYEMDNNQATMQVAVEF